MQSFCCRSEGMASGNTQPEALAAGCRESGHGFRPWDPPTVLPALSATALYTVVRLTPLSASELKTVPAIGRRWSHRHVFRITPLTPGAAASGNWGGELLSASSPRIAPGRTPTPHLIQGKDASTNSSAPPFGWMVRRSCKGPMELDFAKH